jgi:RecA-family ATPase
VKPDLETAWLVEDFLPKSGPAVIVGPPGAGKSFLALDLAAHVAQGKDWAGRHVEGGAVLYVVAEGVSGFRNRIAALIAAKRLESVVPFAFVPTAIDLRTEAGDTAALMATMRAVVKRMGQEPAMIVIDTLSKTFAGGRENTDEMAGYVANCEKIAAKMNCLVLIIHHPSRQSDDERGHSSLRGGVVTSIKISGTAVKTALTVKQKDGPEGEVVHCSLETVVLGTNSRGKEITTCLVHYVDDEGEESGAVGSAIDKAKNRLKGHAKTAFRVLEALQAQSTLPVPAKIPATAIDRAKVQCVIQSGQAADTPATELRAFVKADPDKIADTVERTARRVLGGLKSKGIIGSWEEFLWIN